MSNFEDIYYRQVDSVYKVCFLYLKNSYNTEEAVQETFLRYLKYAPEFNSDGHEKAWFIKTASNICKNTLKSYWIKNVFCANEIEAHQEAEDDNELIEEILRLPDKYKIPIYLFYYEGYNTEDIAQILNSKPSTIRSNLHRGRKLLKDRLECE